MSQDFFEVKRIQFESFEHTNIFYEGKMIYLESEGVKVIDKLYKDKFSFWKIKMKVVLAFMGLWDIVNISEKTLFSNANPKVLKEYQRRVKKAVHIISLNLVDYQLAHIKSCKGLTKAWKTLCNTHKTKNLSSILFVCRKFFTCKMQEGDDVVHL